MDKMSIWEHPVRFAAGLLCIIAALMLIVRLLRPKSTISSQSTAELVQLYLEPGGDDDAGPELKSRGPAARDEVIRMLDASHPDPPDRGVFALVRILLYTFPSEESRAALERLRGRTADAALRRELLRAVTQMRAKLSGRLDAWITLRRDERPDFEEMLLASAAPTDRTLLLPEAAWHELKGGNSTKAEAYARELLADPDLVAKTGDGVYYANQVLGMIAIQKGDVPGAKRYLIDSARTPGSPWLGQGTQDTGLAEALLKHGERDAVLEYLELSKRFWKQDVALLSQWQATIRAGGVPQFDQDRKDR